jgi:hypothetical protein
MGKVTKEALLKMRDLITDMEPNLDFNENTVLCCDRLGNIMTSIVFDDDRCVVAGEILHYEEDEEYNKIMKIREMRMLKDRA